MIGEEIRPVLRAARFAKKRNTFTRTMEGARHTVEFQASQFGSRDAVRFTINLGVDYPELDDPWQLRVRIGWLLPDGDDGGGRSTRRRRPRTSPRCSSP
jgi:hypothetical protein